MAKTNFWAWISGEDEDPNDINAKTEKIPLKSEKITDAWDEAKEEHGESLLGLLWNSGKKKDRPPLS